MEKKSVNKFAICTASVGRENESKYKKCKKDVGNPITLDKAKDIYKSFDKKGKLETFIKYKNQNIPSEVLKDLYISHSKSIKVEDAWENVENNDSTRKNIVFVQEIKSGKRNPQMYIVTFDDQENKKVSLYGLEMLLNKQGVNIKEGVYADNEETINKKLSPFRSTAKKEDDKIGINFRSLMDGELAEYIKYYDERNKFISKLEKRIEENDWLSMSNGITFTKTFTPTKK